MNRNMKPPHHILSAVLVIVAGTIASGFAVVADWIRRFDRSRFNE